MKPLLICIFVLVSISPLLHVQGDILSDPSLLDKPKSNIVIKMIESLDPTYEQCKSKSFPDRGAKLAACKNALRAKTLASQAPVLEVLDDQGFIYKTLWIVNEICVTDATPLLLKLLMEMVDVIAEIVEEIVAEIGLPVNPKIGTQPNGPEWNIKRVNAPDVWKTYGTKGKGVTVANIDTGVRGTHTVLRGNYKGCASCWRDPYLETEKPNDSHGHGSHTMATSVGKDGVGVAPEAKWMSCRGCASLQCLDCHLKVCGQWAICPADPEGYDDNADCSDAPHVINNSWGGDGGSDSYNGVIKAWNAVGIIPVFAIGNNGPKCETAGSPGDQEGVISTGSTNKTDTVSEFSSRGPQIKPCPLIPGGPIRGPDINDFSYFEPLIVAPGEGINSAWFDSDNGYSIISGTSMAAPHVTGAVALMLSVLNEGDRKKVSEIKTLQKILCKSAYTELGKTGSKCGGIEETKYPNQVAGCGRLDIMAAFKAMEDLGLTIQKQTG